MESSPELGFRKNDHLNINLNQDVKSSNTTGLEKFRLIHTALPELDLGTIDTTIEIFKKRLDFPLLISSMTGGTKTSADFNRIFADAAEKHGIAIGVGSQRIAIDNSEKMETFKIRKYAPTTLIFSNLGAIQLNYGFDYSLCQKAVDAIEADALILHLNPLQEALMESGDTRFSGLLAQIEAVCRRVSVPVIIKEVGWGIDWKTAEKLFEAGVAAIDVAGAGGTSWSEVEMHRTQDPLRKKIAAGFRGWGIPTADSIEEIRRHDQTNLVFASGGLADGIDVVKCLALGANLCGIARPFLKAASESAQALDEYILTIKAQAKIAMFAIGARDIANISKVMIKRA